LVIIKQLSNYREVPQLSTTPAKHNRCELAAQKRIRLRVPAIVEGYLESKLGKNVERFATWQHDIRPRQKLLPSYIRKGRSSSQVA
jgi:hypothetical protein